MTPVACNSIECTDTQEAYAWEGDCICTWYLLKIEIFELMFLKPFSLFYKLNCILFYINVAGHIFSQNWYDVVFMCLVFREDILLKVSWVSA